MIIVDFETRSRCDLRRHGGYKYAADPSTDIICCCFLDPENKRGYRWLNPHVYKIIPDPYAYPLPGWLVEALEDPKVLVAAHNAEFDRNIWNFIAEPKYGFPEVEWDRWYCTAALARVNALPGNLEDATRALFGVTKKDHRGAALIRKLSIPQKDGTFNEDLVALHDMAEYCMRDVHAVKDLLDHCRPLTQQEHRDWLISEDINDRGVRVDCHLAERAVHYAKQETIEIQKRLDSLTKGFITGHTQTRRIAQWLRKRLQDHNITDEYMVRYKDGERRYSVDKSVRADYLDRAAELNLPEHVVEVLELTDAGNRSSVAKFQRMVDRAEENDHRVRGAFVFAGAGQTLRFASRGLQLHNMRRDVLPNDEFDKTLYAMANFEPLEGGVMNTLSKLLRPALLPAPGKVFVTGDWSSIEAMGLPWLANRPEAEKVLDVFRKGEDLYLHACKQMDFSDRQVGKVATLSLGYGGSVGAFQAMARNYGITVSDVMAHIIVKRWRQANYWAVRFWNELERAARYAIKYPGKMFNAGHVQYLYNEKLMHGTLLCILPGDVIIQYPKARIEKVKRSWGLEHAITALKASWTPKAEDKEWPRVTLWRGLLAENATQAFCAGILRHALRRLADSPFDNVIMHVHDDITLEVAEEKAKPACNFLDVVMNDCPGYAQGLPLRADPFITTRYGMKVRG